MPDSLPPQTNPPAETLKILEAEWIFDGETRLGGRYLMIRDGRIADLTPSVPAGPVTRLPRGVILSAGFIDSQVNGGGGLLFNEDITVEAIGQIAAVHRQFGTTAMLPTFMSDTRERMKKAIEVVRTALLANVPGILGIHLEGPFLNVARRGVHLASQITQIEEEDIDLLATLGGDGVTLVTLAPECCGEDLIRQLTGRGVIVSAGHTNADAEDIELAAEEGLTGVTHLFNAMSQLSSRAPGVVGAALADDRLYAGIIVDGIHVSDVALKVALRAKGARRLMLVSDAMPPMGTGMEKFNLFGRDIFVNDGHLVTAEGTIAGAVIDMASSVRRMVGEIGATLDDALMMASATPADFLGLSSRIGRLQPGLAADIVALDETTLAPVTTWIAGEIA